jgi:7-keto-8-aminopelargonate synthetase-like enzyme
MIARSTRCSGAGAYERSNLVAASISSNDYLGLANSEALRNAVAAAIDRGVPVGSGGSRLLRGNHSEHEALEAEAARFFRAETALFFGGGFIANTAIFSTLPARGDLIVYDAYPRQRPRRHAPFKVYSGGRPQRSATSRMRSEPRAPTAARAMSDRG